MTNKNQFLNERGQGLIEYLILVALLAVGTMASIRVVGNALGTKFSKVSVSLGATPDTEIEDVHVQQRDWKKRDMRNFMSGALGRNSGGRGNDGGDNGSGGNSGSADRNADQGQ